LLATTLIGGIQAIRGPAGRSIALDQKALCRYEYLLSGELVATKVVKDAAQ
jgi:hypothetical protein